MESNQIAILCANEKSNYFKIPSLDIYTSSRSAFNYKLETPIIAHPPCAQWSRLHKFSKEHKQERDLAAFCLYQVEKNDGILEHPSGSHLFKYFNVPRKRIFCVWQHWFQFPAKKKTLLYCKNVELLPVPLNFNAIEKTVDQLAYKTRSQMTLSFCQYLVSSVLESQKNKHQTLVHDKNLSACFKTISTL